MNGPFAFAEGSARGWLAGVDPRLKIAWVACVSLASVLVHANTALATLVAVASLPAAGLKLRVRGWLAIAAALLLVAWGAVVSQGIFYAGTPRTTLFTLVPDATLIGWKFPGVHFYREGAVYGLTQSARWLALSIVGLTVCLSTSPERLLAALVWLRVPTAVAFMSLAAMRFLPLMLDEWATARRARWLRGFRGERGLRWFSADVSLCVPVLASALRRATSLSTAVTSRGFSPTGSRTSYPELRMRPGERLALTAIVAATLLLAAAWTLVWLGPLFAPTSSQECAAVRSWVEMWL
jgi:energy-coupling factor transport system permease protein